MPENAPAADTWNPRVYGQFADERSRPFYDLLAMVEPRPGMVALDLGCGSGELTRQLHERLGCERTLGIDRSANMLAQAAQSATAGVSFAQGTIEAFAARQEFDLIFSNAAIHWVKGHPALLARLTAALKPAGQLAIQLPDMQAQLQHRTARSVAAEPAFAAALAGRDAAQEAHPPEQYAQWLFELGFARQRVRLEIYAHVLPGVDALVDWARGTLLTPYEQALGSEGFDAFLARYRARLAEELGRDPGQLLLPYRRLLMWGAL